MAGRLTDAALNRALLARQGLLERMDAPAVDAVEAIGAVQAQHWPAPRAALWSRVDGFEAAELYSALDRGELVAGTLLRGTIHLVSAREHAAYAAVAEAFGALDWRRVSVDEPPSAAQEELVAAVVAHAGQQPRGADELVAFVEAWVEEHPGAVDDAELERQREYTWRPLRSTAAFVRAPASGGFGPRTPAGLAAAPQRPPDLDLEGALDAVVRRHLRAFGPAGADDVAQWIGWKVPPVRAALERLEGELERFEDAGGRPLYDLPGAPRPEPDDAVPVRLLPWFDSVLLAYAPGRRARILPDAHRDAVYNRRNLQIRPTFLVEGVVAGTWSIEAKGRKAALTLAPLRKIPKRTTTALADEAERLVRFLHPDASAPSVAVAE
jgi:Winged helix DNA-binding domain